MQPQDPIQLAIQQQQQAQQQNQQPQPSNQEAPSPIQLAQQQIQQYGQENQQSAEAMKQKQNAMQQASKAMATLNPKANSSDSTSNTMSKVGQANSTGNYSYSGECLKWVDDQQGNSSSRQPTAIADYQANAQAGNIETKGTPPKGARVYFSSPDIPAGHVGISDGNGSFTSATDNGVQTFNIDQWQQYAGQSYLGYSTNDK